MTSPEDRLLLDIREDLERVDRVMTQVIADPSTTDEFIRSPSGVLTRLGLHARTTQEIHNRTNRVFYAVLTNTELLEFLADHFESFVAPEDENREVQRSALGRGELEHARSLDEAALNHCLNDREVIRQIFRLTLYDLNNRRVLLNVHSTDELDDYVDGLVDAIVERRSIRDIPVLEEWDAQYGIGKRQGIGIAEVGPVATAVAAVEVALWATVFLAVDSDVVATAQSEALSSRNEISYPLGSIADPATCDDANFGEFVVPLRLPFRSCRKGRSHGGENISHCRCDHPHRR